MEFAKNPLEIAFSDLKKCCESFSLPFKETNLEMIKLRSKTTVGYQNIDQIAELINYENLSQIYANVLSIFASSYLCESSFSKLNFIFSQYRSSLTQEHVKNALIVATTQLNLDLRQIVEEMNCQISH